ncbi:MAG: M23 family metallopeptidase [Syntrophomonadaceae bacterium]|nr:M23 family metallopeptidase [Syntrophomonadaceae bacterium]
MFKHFKIKLLAIIVVATLVSVGFQVNNHTREIITPVLSFMLKDYEIEKKILVMLENSKIKPEIPTVPAMTDSFSTPVENYTIQKNYGWYYNANTKKQEFSPGIYLSVSKNSLVKSVMGGTVNSISGEKDSRNITIKHGDNLYSHYKGLKEVLIEEDSPINKGEVLGKSSDYLYFELKSEEGPLNPVTIFN